MTQTSRSEQRGFTLLELLMVLAILGMAVSLAVPNLNGIAARRFDAQLREAAGMLNHARRMAVVSGQTTEVQFRVAGAPEEGPLAERGDRVNRYRFSAELDLAFRQTTADRPDPVTQTTLQFFPEGGATGGELLLSSRERWALIRVDPFSGKVETGMLDERINP